MRLKLYCNRFKHFKDALVCSAGCAYRTRCQDFALFYDQHREETDALVRDYYEARKAAERPAVATAGDETTSAPKGSTRPKHLPEAAPSSHAPRARLATIADLSSLVILEVKRVMPELTYIWIGKDDQAEVLEHEEVIRRAEHGAKAKSIYRIAQEMELRFQLVPRRGIEKAKRAAASAAAVDAERAAARRSSRPRLVDEAAKPIVPTIPTPDAETPTAIPAATMPRRQRAPRLAKAAGEK